LRRIEEKINSHNRTTVSITSALNHIKNSLYTLAAIRQILYNAVLHPTYESTNAPIRVYWFDDRLEIYSPGGPYGNVTIENFGKPGNTDYHNPNIGEVLKNFGYIQAFGRGIATANREMRINGNPDLLFEVNQSAVLLYTKEKTVKIPILTFFNNKSGVEKTCNSGSRSTG
jgi:ATP-dependent DNA helicase RecG